MSESNEEYDNDEIYDFAKLNFIREQIENMSKFNQVEILRILTNHSDVTVNENKYGIHVNLSELNINVLNELSRYIEYISNQECFLNDVEQEKEKYKNTFFVKDNKDNDT